MVDPASVGATPLLSAQVDTNEPGAPARLKVNSIVLYDSRRDEQRGGMWPDGDILWGSERAAKADNNYAHFWHLMKRRHDFVWALWGVGGLYGDSDNSPPNGYYRREVSEYEDYVLREGT